MSEVLHVINVELIKGKYVLLPFGRVHVAMPVIHTVGFIITLIFLNYLSIVN